MLVPSGATDGVNEADGNVTADALKVDGVSYTFPLGDALFFVGDNHMLVLYSQLHVLTVE